MLRHAAVAVAILALVAGCALWLVEQAPHRPPPVNLGVSVRASPAAFAESSWQALRERPLDTPALPCEARSFTAGPVSAQLLDITSRLPDSLWQWQVSDRYAGPVLVRGVESGGARVAFQVQADQFFAGESGTPSEGGGFPELTLNAPEYRFTRGAVTAWVEVRFPKPGCYQVQADGLGFQQREVIDIA